MAEVAALTIANICLDVQIGICMFLHPSDILALRKTCKSLQPSTRQRIVWVAALHRVCLDNTLFLPSFLISDMSDLELEKTAMGPRRWIELCGAFEKQNHNDPGATLCPRATRITNDCFPIEIDYEATDFFIVPGGRYLVGSSPDGISVFDLGYSSSADCKLIASVGSEGGSDTCMFQVQATPDGMGLTIFAFKNSSVYEIYPQSETPHLTQIAHLDFDPSMNTLACLLPGTVIWHDSHVDMIVFRVWDYRLNHSISFSVDVDCLFRVRVMATTTVVIVLCGEEVLIWAIPPLSPQPPDFLDNPTHMPPLFTIPFPPDSISPYFEPIRWNIISSWYFGSSHPLYFDMLCQDFKLHRFQIMLKPDLSTASLHAINTSELSRHDFNCVSFEDYRICEDTLVSCLFRAKDLIPYQRVYTGLTSDRFANIISQGGPATKMLLPDIGHEYRLLSACPASGKFVLLVRDGSNSVVVLDFF